MNLKLLLSLLIMGGVFLSGLLTFSLGSDAEKKVPVLLTSRDLTPFSIWGRQLAYTYFGDNIKRYDFGGGTTQIFDNKIESESVHFHRIAFGFYRESDSWVN